MKLDTLTDLERYRDTLGQARRPDVEVNVSGGTCGCAAGACAIFQQLEQAIHKESPGRRVALRITGCHGFCTFEPIVSIATDDRRILYGRVQPQDVPEIVQRTVAAGEVIDRLTYQDSRTGQHIADPRQIPFFAKQTRRVLARNDHLDPLEIDSYVAAGGYRGLARALGATPEAVIAQISQAGLRGRGGAGFPTGHKWQLARQAVATRLKGAEGEAAACYVVCNADEGDPGAFMDRSILEGNPHALIEGMLIGAYAVSAGTDGRPHGLVYVRTEYPMAIRHLDRAIEQARAAGLLGPNILGSALSFDIDIVRGAGAFVCGEETALLESIEDRIGEPRSKPPYPVQAGLHGQPTVLNNVKTWVCAALILEHDPAWFAEVGTDRSKGTMVFSLVGKIRNTGLIEVPMGITLRQVVEDIGEGLLDDRPFKAVQTGGPSGGCLPRDLLDLPVDYESLTGAGTIMGSGGMIVMDDRTCMVDTARYFLNFAMEESCGKCTPCREAVAHMCDILTAVTQGRGRPEDLDLLEQMGEQVRSLSFCGLGKTAPSPALSTLRYFRDEYEAHLQGRCPAGVCKALITYRVVDERCTGCTACARVCPVQAVSGQRRQLHAIDPQACVRCGLCVEACKFDAIEVR